MSENTIIWSVWISETNKVISTKQIPNSKEMEWYNINRVDKHPKI